MMNAQLRRLIQSLAENAQSAGLLRPDTRVVVDKADLAALTDYLDRVDRAELAVFGTIGAPGPDVVIALADGAASAVRIPPGCNVEIRDYDCPEDFGELEIDEHGDSYQCIDMAGAPI